MLQKNTLSKDQLAKLMATEDITVQHSQSAKTASFDVKYRVLTLPNWEASTTDITDLLIGHEVAHALWTLEKDWEHALSNNLHKGITNVVEDARIERRIKAKYPGLVKIMIRGYRELEKRRFFYEEPSDIDSMNFIDRVNLHCKLGPLAAIPFTDIELPYVEMVENTSSWGSVETCVKLIMDFMGSEEYKEQQQQQRMENAEGLVWMVKRKMVGMTLPMIGRMVKRKRKGAKPLTRPRIVRMIGRLKLLWKLRNGSMILWKVSYLLNSMIVMRYTTFLLLVLK